MADILADRAETLGELYWRHLSGKTRELRFYLERSAVRISYWLARGARVVLLTVFRKTRQVKRAEVARAVAAAASMRLRSRGAFAGQRGVMSVGGCDGRQMR